MARCVCIERCLVASRPRRVEVSTVKYITYSGPMILLASSAEWICIVVAAQRKSALSDGSVCGGGEVECVRRRGRGGRGRPDAYFFLVR